MAGAYCRRCFVYRVLPGGSWSGHMATCTEGMAHDREVTGHDHTTANNPLATSVLHIGNLSFEFECGTLRILRDWHGERLDCGSFWMLPEEFGALAAWLAERAESGSSGL